jgi:hypothetical protein
MKSPNRPLNDVERDRMSPSFTFHSEDAIHNAEEVDGFFAALICSPEIAKPNEYLVEIWGGTPWVEIQPASKGRNDRASGARIRSHEKRGVFLRTSPISTS